MEKERWIRNEGRKGVFGKEREKEGRRGEREGEGMLVVVRGIASK